jgi:hypothetical protein
MAQRDPATGLTYSRLTSGSRTSREAPLAPVRRKGQNGGLNGRQRSGITRQTGEVLVPLGVFVLAGSWLIIVTLLVLDLSGVLHRGTGFRWEATGLLIINTAVDASGFAHLHGWTGRQIYALQSATWPVMLAGFATVIVGVTIQERERRKARRAG